MYYLLFGKFNLQSKLLPPSMKVYYIDKEGIINMYAHKYKHHKLKNNLMTNDVIFLDKVKIYRLDDQYESNGDFIMIDTNEDKKYNYYEIELQNKSLSEIITYLNNTLKDNNIIIHIFSNI